MRILVANDDGIGAPGIKCLERAARQLSDDVWVVAPEAEQSAASHSLTLHRPLRLRRISRRRFAVNGTPTDCVYLAFNKLLSDHRPDLVLSGINRGSNVGEDVTYSGTIAAAMEATLLGVPAIALSQFYDDSRRVHWATAERWTPRVVRALLDQGWPDGVLINVNFPARAADQVRGMRAGRQGTHQVGDSLEERVDPRGGLYYWVGQTTPEDTGDAAGTDLRAIKQGYISLTPLHLDLTHGPSLRRLRKAFP